MKSPINKAMYTYHDAYTYESKYEPDKDISFPLKYVTHQQNIKNNRYVFHANSANVFAALARTDIL